MSNENQPRFRFYREHKYINFKLFEFEKLAAKIDFRNTSHLEMLQDQFSGIEGLLKSHAEWEESEIHKLLIQKNLSSHHSIESDHEDHEIQFKKIREILTLVLKSTSDQEKINLGNEFYLLFRKFLAEVLIHLHHEETVVMPELQRHYSDEELRAVECVSYRQMTPEDMLAMTQTLFPHMNAADREFFLTEIKQVEPEKFLAMWGGIAEHIESRERELLMKKLNV